MANTPTDPNQAQAWISGEPPDQTIDFYIPRGNTGPMGPVGPVGPSLTVGDIVVTAGPAAPGTVGPQGATGPKGDPGGFVQTPLGSSDLNTVLATGIYTQQDGSLPSLARNYPGVGTLPGILYVHQRTSSSILQSYKARVYNSNTVMWTITYDRWSNDTGASWSPWRATVPTRVDQTAGRAIYAFDDINLREQLIWGDTGSRIISDVVDPANWAAGYTVKLRRVGSQVELRLLGLQAVTGKSGSLSLFNAGYTLPPGFQNQHSFAFPIVDNTGTISNGNQSYGGGPLTIVAAAGRSYGVLLTWQSLNSWPTTLPGTADSAPIAT